MTRFCETCQTNRPLDEFDAQGLCRKCNREAREGLRSVKVALPPNWRCPNPQLPEMSVPALDDVQASLGVRWAASNGPWALEVVWYGDRARFLCTASKQGERAPRDCRPLVYPHEVVSWLGTWIVNLSRSGYP